jgi:putative ABC transport system permease protein
VDTLVQDIRFGARMLMRNPAVTIVAVVTLALGLGANTAIFSTMNSLMLRPLPVRNADRLTVIAPKLKGDDGYNRFSYLDYRDLRLQASALTDVLAYNLAIMGLDTSGKAEPVVISEVSANFFQALGLQPAVGTLVYGDQAEDPGAQPVVVLAYGYWKKRFNADPRVIGKQVKLNGHSVTIIGVAPEGFHGLCSIVDMQAYIPLGVQRLWSDNDSFWAKRDHRGLSVLGFLKPGMSLKQAQASANLVMQRLARQYPEFEKGISLHVIPEALARPDPDASDGLVIVGVLFTLLADLVLLLACSNVANILLVRTAAREREMAVRAALGAGRLRMVRQLLTESLLLSLLGALAGLGLGYCVSSLLSSIRVEALTVPLRFDFGFDWRVFANTVGAGVLTGALVGLVPAWRASRPNLNQVLHADGRGTTGLKRRSWLRSGVVVAQIAGSMMLLAVAGLFLRSARNAEQVYLGFDPHHVLNLTMDTQNIGFDKARARQFYRALEDRVRVLPGVQSASLASSVPMGYINNSRHVYAEGQVFSANESVPATNFAAVDPAYFATMKIPLVRGRAFTDGDTDQSPLVAIVNEAMAARLWPDQDAIGRRFRAGDPDSTLIEIVGVTRQGKYGSPAEEPAPFFYLPQAQAPTSYRVLQIRAAVAPEVLIPAVQAQIHDLAPELPVFGVETMEQTLEGANGLLLFRIGTNLTAALGFLGLGLALVGVYGVISYVAAQRTREIGVRMALGADRKDIRGLVLRQGVKLVGAGVLLGLLVTYLVSHAIASLLLGVGPGDPLTLISVATFLAAVGLVASYIPARRAMEVDPIRALNHE